MPTNYNTVSNQNMIDVCLNTYGDLSFMGKLLKDNDITTPLYSPMVGELIEFDETLITDRLIYNQRKVYATNQ
jgi:hypothetical protein